MLCVPWRRGVSLAVALAALAVLLLPAPARAYCRTTTAKLPESYNPTRGCYTQGLLLFWKNACVGYSINAAAAKSISLEDATRIIDASFATWTDATCPATGAASGIEASNLGPVSCADIGYRSTGPNQNLIVFRDDRWPYRDAYNTLGLTTVTFNAETGEIYDADMEINATGHNLSITDRVSPRGFDLASVLTHEVGHFFGLAHATDTKSTMYASYKPGTTSLRTLADDDVEGLCAIYPDATMRVVSPSVSANETVLAGPCDPTPRHGFSSSCSDEPRRGCKCGAATGAPSAGAAAPWLVALGLVGRRLRRRRRAARG